jgi:hypothetical protein
MVIAAILAIHLLQTPPAKAPAPTPQNPAPSRLIERPQLRPGRLDNARENLARDPNEPRLPAEAPEPEAPSEPEVPQAPEQPPPPPPAAGPAPMAPSATAQASAASAPATAPAAPRAKGAAAWLSLLPIASPLAMLVGPGIGLLWLAMRRPAAQ